MRLDSVRELKQLAPGSAEQDVRGPSRGGRDRQPRGRQRGVAEARSPELLPGGLGAGEEELSAGGSPAGPGAREERAGGPDRGQGQGRGGRALRGPYPRPRQAVVPIEAAPAAHRLVHRVPGQRVHHGRHAGVLRPVRVVERAVHPLEQPRPGGREPVPQGRTHRPARRAGRRQPDGGPRGQAHPVRPSRSRRRRTSSTAPSRS